MSPSTLHCLCLVGLLQLLFITGRFEMKYFFIPPDFSRGTFRICTKPEIGFSVGAVLRSTRPQERWNRNWLFVPLKGRWVKIKKYRELFVVLGTQYGGR